MFEFAQPEILFDLIRNLGQTERIITEVIFPHGWTSPDEENQYSIKIIWFRSLFLTTLSVSFDFKFLHIKFSCTTHQGEM